MYMQNNHPNPRSRSAPLTRAASVSISRLGRRNAAPTELTNGQRRSWGRRRRLRLLSVVVPLLALCSCEWFVLLSCVLLSCACDLLICLQELGPYVLNYTEGRQTYRILFRFSLFNTALISRRGRRNAAPTELTTRVRTLRVQYTERRGTYRILFRSLDSDGATPHLRGWPQELGPSNLWRGFHRKCSSVIFALGCRASWGKIQFYVRVKSLPGVNPKPPLRP